MPLFSCILNTFISGSGGLSRGIANAVKRIKLVQVSRLFVVSFLVLSAKCYSIQQQIIPKLKFGYSEFAPYTYTTDNRLAVGEVTNIVKTLIVDAGFKFVAVPESNRRLFQSIVTDKIDLLMVVPFQNADSDKLIFGEKTFDRLDTTVFWLAGKTPAINDINQLQNKAIIAIAGYSYGGIFRGKGSLVNTERLLLENHTRTLKALFLERAPYLLAYKKPAMFYLKQKLKEKLSFYTLYSLPLVLSIRRSYPNAENVLKELETRYAESYPERFRGLNPKRPIN